MATAKTKADVKSQSSRDRLWDELDTKYGQQREASNQAYNKAFSQTGAENLKRGMGRSSYGAQTQANVLAEKNKAADQIYENQIASEKVYAPKFTVHDKEEKTSLLKMLHDCKPDDDRTPGRNNAPELVL